jgi:hypothetical protein
MAQDPVELDDQPVVLDTNIDDLRALLTKREYRVPISKELTALLERRK